MTAFIIGFICGAFTLAFAVSCFMAYTVADIESNREGIED